MKRSMVVVLLMSICSFYVGKTSPASERYAYELMFARYLVLNEIIRMGAEGPRLQPIRGNNELAVQQNQLVVMHCAEQKSKKQEFKQKQQQYAKNNNRVDRRTHAQKNKRIHQPRERRQRR